MNCVGHQAMGRGDIRRVQAARCNDIDFRDVSFYYNIAGEYLEFLRELRAQLKLPRRSALTMIE